MRQVLLVGLGGAIGSVVRYLAGIAIVRWLGSSFPFNTLLVNIVGSFVMGVLIATLLRIDQAGVLATDLRLFLAVGVLGGFTTFSSFSADVVVLWERGLHEECALYVMGSVALSIVAVFLGLLVVRRLGE